MLIIVCYDVTDDRRRLRLYRLLEGYGRPIQRSVFECDLGWPDYRRLRHRVERLVDLDEDRVRFYLLCKGCTDRREVLGGPPVERDPDYYLA